MGTLVLQPDATDGIDTRLREANPAFNYGVTDTMSVGGSSGTIQKGLIKFDLSSVPADLVITSAILWLSVSINSASRDLSIHRSLVQWYEGDGNGAPPSGDGSSWEYRNANGTVAWTGGAGGVAGTEYVAGATDTQTVAEAPTTVEFDVTVDVQDFYDGTYTNHGWWILLASETITTTLRTSDNATSGNRPKLTITYEDFIVSEQETISVSDSPDAEISYSPGYGFDAITVSESVLAQNEFAPVATQDNIGLAENLGLLAYEPNYFLSVGESVTLSESFRYESNAPGKPRKYALPLLYLTDGTRVGGRLQKFDLLSKNAGYLLCDWEPTIAQQKGGGVYNESALVSGRRLVSYAYENPIETLTLSANGHNQQRLITYTRELLRWLEQAAEYWTSRWAKHPVYLVARSAYEANTRYAVIYNASVPKLKNPYSQGFFAPGNVFYDSVEVYLERGDWLDQPPDTTTCVPLSTAFSWNWAQTQVVAETTSGTIKALIECDGGTVLAGSTDAAKVYVSSDNGQTWALLATLGTGTDTINAFTKDGSGNLYAAVSGASSVGGVWRSTNNGATWTRMTGGINVDTYARAVSDWQVYDVAFCERSGYVHAVGDVVYDLGGLRVAGFLDSPDGTTWSGIMSTWYYYRAVGIAFDFGILPNVLLHYTPGGATGNAWLYYNATDHISMGFTGRFMGPYAYGGYDLVGWDSGLSSPQPWSLLAALKTPSGGADTIFYKLFLGANYYYGPVSQITSEVIYGLYVDPDSSNPTKRIYAGGDGDIYVSDNGGYSWSLHSNAPTGKVYAFLRTTDGALIAGGEDGIVLSEEDQTTVPTQVTIGQTAVCAAPGVYVGNQRFLSNLTNVFEYDAGTTTYTELYPMTAFPVELLPSVPAVGDAIYFGAQSDMAELDAGPFSSLIFYLDEDQLGRDITITWEYWNGGAWAALAVEDKTEHFTAAGVKSVSWHVVAANWDTTDVETITGWWVRARVSAIGTNPQSPRQIGLNVYTVNSTFAEISENTVGGDIPALSEITWQNAADYNNSGNPAAYVDRLLVGLRSYDRGEVFNSLINISDQQLPFGFTLTAGTYSVWSNLNFAPTGRALCTTYTVTSFDDPTDAWQDLVTVAIDNTIAEAYYGTFRVLARVYRSTGDADDWRMRLAVRFGTGGQTTYSKNYPYVATTSACHVLDFGSITIPSEQSVVNNVGDALQLVVQGWGTTGSVAVCLVDLALIPVDEWSADVMRPSYNASETAMRVGADNYLEITSALTKASSVVATNRTSGGLIKAYYQVVTNGKGILQVGARQRLWFYAMTQAGAADWASFPHALGQVQVSCVQRYKALRGNT